MPKILNITTSIIFVNCLFDKKYLVVSPHHKLPLHEYKRIYSFSLLNFMFLKSFGSVVTVFALSLGSTAIAQTNNNNLYIQVGSDVNGHPMALDLASVKENEYILVQKHGNGTLQTTFHAACGQRRLFSQRLSVYTSAGQLTRDDQAKREIFPKPGTPEANAMEIVCRGGNAQK